MQPVFASAYEQVPAPALACRFAIRHLPDVPTYHELLLENNRGGRVRWVVPSPLPQLGRWPVLLWRPTALPRLGSLACLETGALQLAPAHAGSGHSLCTELARGVLRLHFRGRLLRGYFRLHCLPTGCGQFWQLTPIRRA